MIDPRRLAHLLTYIQERCGLRRQIAVMSLPAERRPIVAELRRLKNKLGEIGEIWITVEGNPLPKLV